MLEMAFACHPKEKGLNDLRPYLMETWCTKKIFLLSHWFYETYSLEEPGDPGKLSSPHFLQILSYSSDQSQYHPD